MEPSKNKSTILVVDDDDTSRMLLSEILEDFPVNVIETCSAIEALWFLKQFRNEIKVLLIDIVLPDSDGFIFLLQSREIIGNIPALAISAISPFELERKSKIAGFQKWISKPIEIEELKKIINSMLS